MENRLDIGIKDKERFLEDLRNLYGGSINLRNLQIRFKNRCLSIPIEECRFTGIDGLSEKDEFTGTMREIIERYGMSIKELTNPEIIEWLVKLFTAGEDWINYIKGEEFDSVKCVPIDRLVSEIEVRDLLRHLAEEAKKAKEAENKE